jgi:hypothetical protein
MMAIVALSITPVFQAAEGEKELETKRYLSQFCQLF